MEFYEVIGIQHKTGMYENQPYDNMVFSVTVNADVTKGEVGLIASTIKIKTSLLTTVPKLGDVIQPMYDRFGRVCVINVKD